MQKIYIVVNMAKIRRLKYLSKILISNGYKFEDTDIYWYKCEDTDT